MISALIYLIILLVVAGLVYWLVLQLPIPEPFMSIIRVAVVVVCILVVVGLFFGGLAIPAIHLR